MLAAVLAIVAAALIYATSRAGNERILGIVLQNAQENLRGSLKAKTLEFNGRHLALRDVVLRDPEGEVVAQVAALELDVSLLSLARETLDLSMVRIEKPQLHLRSDERGLNLVRAIESPKPAPPKQPAPESKPSSFAFAVRTIEVTDGFVDFEQVSGDSQRRVRLQALHARGSATYGGTSEVIDVDLGVDARITRPTEGPVSLRLRAVGKADRREGEVALRLAGLQLSASGQTAGQQITARVKTLRLAPETARAFLPSYPLLVPVSLSAEGAQNGNVVAAKLEVDAGRAHVVAEGSVDLARSRAEGVTLRARGIDLEQLLEGGPQSDLTLEAHAEGGGSDLDTLDGKLELIAPASEVKEPLRLRGEPIGPIRIRAVARRGELEVPEVLINLPGVNLTGSGRGSSKHVSGSAKVTASDLTALSQTLGGLARMPPPRLAGAGELEVSVKGPVKHLAISVKGGFPSFRYEDYAVQSLTLSGSLPDLQRPLESQLSVTAATVQLSNRVLRRLSVGLASQERNLEAEVRAEGELSVWLHATARVDPDNKGLLLSSFRLRYPEADWLLQQPAKIRFASGDASAEQVELKSGAQAIRFHGALRGQRLRAEAEVEKLDLAQLPKAFVDPALKLSGMFNARIRASGKLPRPAVEAHVDLRRGQFKQYSNLGLAVNALYDNDRATGTLAAQGLDAHLRAQFDVPIQALLQTHKPEPVHFAASVDQTRVEDVVRALGRSDPVSGIASGEIELLGTADDPRLTLTFNGKALRYRELPPADVVFSTSSDEGGKIRSRLELAVADSKSTVAVRTPLTLGGVLKRPPTSDSVMAMALAVDADIHDFPLALLQQAELIEQDIRGKLSATAAVQGTVSSPSGKVTLAVAQGALGAAPPVDASLVATATSTGIQVSINAQQERRRLLDATASLNAAIANLKDMETVAGTPLTVKLTLGPLTLDELRHWSGSEPERGVTPVKGVLHADLAISGTLRDPRVSFRSEVDQLSAEHVGIGKAQLDYSYASARSDLTANVTTSGGALQIKGNTRLDLSYPSVTKSLSYGSAPLDVSLQANEFELGFLSGISPTVRTIGGKLRASATIQGTVAVPKIQGQLEWSQGQLAVLGYGEYQNIHLQVEGTEQKIQLKELLAKSGGGQLKLVANADRSGSKLSLTGNANLDKFPIISDDQLLATVSARATIEGEMTPQLINIRRLQIPEAHVELPDTKRKDLQKLDLPDDIVLVRNGKPLDKGKLKKAPPSQGVGGAGVEPPQQQAVRQITIAVDAPRNLWVKSSDLNVEAGLAEGFHVEVAQAVAIFGQVNILRGRVDVLGRRFDFQKDSDIRFGGPPTTPYVNVTVLHNNESEQVKVYITVRGQGKDVTIKPSSEPPLSETEIYTLIATGRRTLKHNSGATSGSSQAASIVGSLAASELKKTLASKLPLDVLSIQAGESGGLTGSKLEAGTYVTDQIYIGYTGRIGARPERGENSNAVRLEYQITPRWSLEGEYGDAKAGSADLIWSRDY